MTVGRVWGQTCLCAPERACILLSRYHVMAVVKGCQTPCMVVLEKVAEEVTMHPVMVTAIGHLLMAVFKGCKMAAGGMGPYILGPISHCWDTPLSLLADGIVEALGL